MPAYHKRGQDTAASPRSFAGFPRSNTTQVPDVFFDEIMPFLNLAELRVMSYVIRRTIGFKKDWDGISIDQLVNGIFRQDGSRFDWGTQLTEKTVKGALRSLIEKGFLIVEPQFDANGRQRENLYSLKWQDTGGVKSTPLPRVATTPLPPPSNYPPQYTVKTTNSRTRDSSKREVSVNGKAAAAATTQSTQQTPPLPSSISEDDYPKTSRWVRYCWPTIDEALLLQIYDKACRIAGDRIDDQDMLDAFRTGTRANQKSPALYLKTVPSVVKSWL